jgi:hypothetical protein
MDVSAALGANRQAAKLVQPGQGPLNDPAMAPQPVGAPDTFAGDPNLDVSLAQRGAAAGTIVRLIRVPLLRSPAPLPGGLFDRRDGVEHLLEDRTVVAVGARQAAAQRQTAAVDHKVALRARFAPIRWIRTGVDAPFLAGMLALSMLARVQSSWSACPRRSKSTWCNRSQTPASCQSRRRRQQVMPLPQPSSWGSISQGIPDWSTKMIPVKQARSGTRGRPPLGFAGAGGNNGAMLVQRSSGTSGVLMPTGAASSGPRFC